jgi:diadenosine tetraphosphate (Ap4A) HIT family hydrolase
MPLDRIWAGWRATYIEDVALQRPSEGGCLFERLLDADPDEALILARVDDAFAVMNAYPYTSGHLMIAPTRHVATLAELSREEAAALIAMTQDATVALERAFTPDGINVGMNLGRSAGAGIPGHLHVHALPRWSGDTNFMTSVAEARVLPEPLHRSWERLKAAWPEPSG